MRLVMSTSLKVVSIAYVFCACFSRSDTRLRSRDIGTRRSRSAPASGDGAEGSGADALGFGGGGAAALGAAALGAAALGGASALGGAGAAASAPAAS